MFVQTKFFKVIVGMIAVIQVILGATMILAPAQFAELSGLAAAPEWTGWLFAMFGARCLGYAVGMFAAMRQPVEHRLWIQTMIGVQAIDWVATLAYLAAGSVTLAQVTTASFAPIIFVAALIPALRLGRSAGRVSS